MFNTGTQRTAMALELARLSSGFVALTGTPIVDSRAYTLMTWLELVVPFEVNKRNFWVAANSMVAKLVATGVIVQREEVEVAMSPAQRKRYQGLVQPRHGGHERNDSSEYSYHEAATLGYEVCEAAMVAKTFDIVSKSPPQHRLDPGLKKGAQVRFQSDGDDSFRLGKISDNGKVRRGCQRRSRVWHGWSPLLAKSQHRHQQHLWSNSSPISRSTYKLPFHLSSHSWPSTTANPSLSYTKVRCASRTLAGKSSK